MTLGTFGRYAGPATLILSSLADGAKHGYALTKDIDAVRRGAAGPGHAVRGAQPARSQGPDRAAAQHGPAAPVPAHRDRRRRAAGTPASPAPGGRRRPAPPGQDVASTGAARRPARPEARAARAVRLLRWYPASWRVRYGAEFTELLVADLAERPRCWRRTADVAVSGTLARLSQAGLGGQRLARPTRPGPAWPRWAARWPCSSPSAPRCGPSCSSAGSGRTPSTRPPPRWPPC